ncbi:GNAT family N-acetyltransferase [Hymenobacter sp. HD11105]
MLFSDLSLAQRLERAEASANAQLVEARARLFPESQAQWIEVSGAYAMFDGQESFITQTFGLGLFAEVTAADLDTLEAFFKERQAPVYYEVSPLAGSALLPLLTGRGYQPIEFTSVMCQPLALGSESSLANGPLKTRPIEAGEEKLWARTSARGWSSEHPDLSDFMFEFGQISAQSRGGVSFLAELDGQPIATGSLFVHDGVALLAGASTVPEGRRQGAQQALLQARLQYAAEQGCTMAMMGAEPGSQSQRNAEKRGFRIAYTRIKWQLK